MADTDQAQTSAALDTLLRRVCELVPDDCAKIAQGLAKAAYRRWPAERLAALDLEAAARRLADATGFVAAREPGELALRVLNPTVARDGWTSAGTVVQINVEDGPFLLSTITGELDRLGRDVVETMHPIVGVDRAADGTVIRVRPARHAKQRESWIHLGLADRLDDQQRDELEERLRSVLSDALRATADFPTMKERMSDVAARLPDEAVAAYGTEVSEEAVAFLRWLLADHFVLLGYRRYQLTTSEQGRLAGVRHGSGLGILADTTRSTWAQPVPIEEIPEALRARIESGGLLTVSQTNRISTVHRRERMIYVGVKKLTDGEISGEHRFVGLFAQKAYAEPASDTPVLRRKLATILEREDFVDHSHDERTIRALFEALPKAELFAADVDDLRTMLIELVDQRRAHEVHLQCRVDPDGRSAAVLIALPRERFNAGTRKRMQTLVEERFEATSIDYHLSLGDREQALIHFVVHADPRERPQGLAKVGKGDLERDIVALTRTWSDALSAELAKRYDGGMAERLAQRWGSRLPVGYQQASSAAEAVEDIAELEALEESGGVRMRLSDASGRMRFKLYKAGPGVELSGFLPILESLGMVVVEEVPHRLDPVEGPGRDGPASQPGRDGPASERDRQVHIHDFGVRVDAEVDIGYDGPRLAQAAVAMWRGEAEADSLNQLVVRAGLVWEQVAVLRAYRRYRRQVGTTFTEAYLNQALSDHPEIARALMELFAAKFGPRRAGDAGAVEEARREVVTLLDALERLDQDRILRGYLGLIDATLRTNYYRRPRRLRLALKFDSARVPEVGKPVPHAEIFVYSPAMEGVHLRAGAVSRGGIRWSDRIEDFRTEVLGLMKAQVVKNAVIVPTGSKGGFVLKRPPDAGDAVAVRKEVRDCYAEYVRALLDVTDNVVGGSVEPPERVRRADPDDPYLVVAADRGTATFSDLANSISDEYDFWLGDAFASGGSHGYDHKAMGITARGAWVAVQRHFRELDVDVQSETIRVIAIGDMSGDVCGNGLMRSGSVQLVAAFDHRDIFVDPDPDSERSYAERRRLYQMPSSSWQDYDRSLISDGGGVWSRQVVQIPLSEQMRALLRVDAESLSPPEVIRALLSAPADLLFAGGIGTFVKASSESDGDVGDRANDGIRVDADRLGARVVAEGGNLAVTQRGRIQYARRGGRINIDAIDNSAGVDTSDREVNLKILLRQATGDGRVDPDERDALLRDVTDDVARRVLRDVYLQTWVLSQELAFSPGGMQAYEQFMVDLTDAGRLDRDVEALPSSREMAARREAGAGLTRPELAVLLGHSKIDLRARLLGTDLPDDEALRPLLTGYFPAAIVERFDDLLDGHRLRRDLVATALANDLVNRMGITYVSRTAHELGCMAADVAAAYWAARGVADADDHWRAVEVLDGTVDTSVQLELKHEVDRLVDTFTRNYIREGVRADLADTQARDRPAFQQLEKVLNGSGRVGENGPAGTRRQRYSEAGVPDEVSQRLLRLGDLALVPDVAAVARQLDLSVEHVAESFFAISEQLPLERLYRRLQSLEPEQHWERWQHRGLADELRHLRRTGAAGALAAHPEGSGRDAVSQFLSARSAARDRAVSLMSVLERESDAGLSGIAVVARALRDVLTV